MFLLILESLGSTELVFILVMALVFFGPRKLPQISRTLGKSLADFRRASEDFKRTWDKEVTLEETGGATSSPNQFLIPEQNSIAGEQTAERVLQPPAIGVIAPDRVIAREALNSETLHASDEAGSMSDQTNRADSDDEPKHSPKSEWL